MDSGKSRADRPAQKNSRAAGAGGLAGSRRGRVERPELASAVEVAGRYTDLRRGGRSWSGRCPHPDHEDSTPSFHVYEDDGHFHCFGCQWHGDAIDLVREIEGLSFAEALRQLGRDAPSSVRRKRGKKPTQRDRENRAYSLAYAAREVVREKLWFWQRNYENGVANQPGGPLEREAVRSLAGLFDAEMLLEERLRILSEGDPDERRQLLENLG